VTPQDGTDIAGTQYRRVFLHQVNDLRLAKCMVPPSEYIDTCSTQFFKRRPGHARPMGRILCVGHDDGRLQVCLELRKQSPYDRASRTAKDIADEQ
jgi:hypothetical protein